MGDFLVEILWDEENIFYVIDFNWIGVLMVYVYILWDSDDNVMIVCFGWCYNNYGNYV